MNRFIVDRDGEPDVVYLVMAVVSGAAMIAIAFALYEAYATIDALDRVIKEGSAHGQAVAAVLTATGGFIKDVLLALSGFGLAVAGYQWTDAKNKTAFTP